jgi:hypothetical protein
MSLVHEALRKAEREKQRKTGAVPGGPPAAHQPAPPPPAQTHTPIVHAPVAAIPFTPPMRGAHPDAEPPSTERSPDTTRSLLPALIGCVAIVAIIAIVFLVSNVSSLLRQTKENVPAVVAPAVAVPAAPSPAPADPPSVAPPTADSAPTPAVPPPTTPPIDESKYKISGIMKDPDGKPMAIINGRATYEGYYVDGAIVEKIEDDRATINVNGQKTVLRLH